MTRSTLCTTLLVLVCAAASTGCWDTDGDGFVDWVARDCDDRDPSIYPGAPELCDGKDNDCDGDVDEDGLRAFRDDDFDGVGSNRERYVCSFVLPAGTALSSGDCDDRNAAVRPGASELCDGVDNDCDGQVDEGAGAWFYRDADGDGWGAGDATRACTAPSGFVARDGDCNDRDAAVRPDAAGDACGGPAIDADCDGVIRCPDREVLDVDLADVASPVAGRSATAAVALALTEPAGVVLFWSRVEGARVVSRATWHPAPVDTLGTTGATVSLGQFAVLTASEWSDLDGDGRREVAVVVDAGAGAELRVLSGAALRGDGGEPELRTAPTPVRPWLGTWRAGTLLFVSRDDAPSLQAWDLLPDEAGENSPSGSWPLAEPAPQFAVSRADSPRLVALSDDGGEDALASYASLEFASLDDASATRALVDSAAAAALAPGPADSGSGRPWVFVARRLGTGELEVSWVLDTLRSVTREGGEVLELPGDTDGPGPVLAWAGTTGAGALIAGTTGALWLWSWRDGRPDAPVRLVPPSGATVGAALTSLPAIGEGGTSAVFVSSEGGDTLGWLLWR